MFVGRGDVLNRDVKRLECLFRIDYERCPTSAGLPSYFRVEAHSSVEEAEDLSSNMLGTGLVVVHDTLVGGKDDDTELTGGEDGVGEVLELLDGQIETG